MPPAWCKGLGEVAYEVINEHEGMWIALLSFHAHVEYEK